MPRYRTGRRTALLLSLALALLAMLGPAARAASAEEARLEDTRAKIAEVQAQLADATAAVAADEQALAEADRQLTVVQEAVAEAERAVQRQRQAVTRARQRLTQLQAEAVDHFQLMALRAASLYKHGRPGTLVSMLTSASAAEAVQRSDYVGVVTRADRRTFERMEIAQAEVAAQQDELAGEQRVLARVLDEQRQLLAAAEEVQRNRAIAAAASRRRVEELKQQESHLAAEGRELAALARRPLAVGGVSRSARGAISPAGPAPAAGAWVFPTDGPITSPFGRRWGRLHSGIDIGAPTGTPIYAAAGGVVTHAGRMSGYGNIVLIDHGGGVVTAYAHQSRIGVRVDQQVSAGDVIGAVGSTGNSTGPHLHFEVRVNGVPHNPGNYL